MFVNTEQITTLETRQAGLEPTFDHSKTASKGCDVTSKTTSGIEKPRNIAKKRRYREHWVVTLGANIDYNTLYFELSNGLDIVLYKNIPLPICFTFLLQCNSMSWIPDTAL